jgi:predicted nuclease of predicted toxin-antitoxin system
VKLTDYPLLTDENIDPAVVAYLRQAGFDVRDVVEDHLIGSTDRHLLSLAVSEGRVVVTQDSDFGTLVIGQHEPVIGIVYLRPGHIDSQFTIDSIQTLLNQSLDLPRSFIIAVRRSGVDVTIRVRDLSPSGEEVEA